MSIQIKLIRRKINVSSIYNSCVHEFKMKSSNLNLRYFFFVLHFKDHIGAKYQIILV